MSSKLVNQVFKFMNEENKIEVALFCNNTSNRYYDSYDTYDQILTSQLFEGYNVENEDLKMYSGYNFRNINNAIRGTWNYEENGHIDNKEEFLSIANNLSEYIKNNPKSIGDTLVYRGVNISYFKDYGVENINDLKKLEGGFLVDQGFVSTSLLEDRCFYQRENELGINYNVKIIYKVPSEFDDLAILGDNAYNKEQCECLINTMNLAKVENVSVDNDTATINVLLVPKKVYDDYYKKGSIEKSV